MNKHKSFSNVLPFLFSSTPFAAFVHRLFINLVLLLQCLLSPFSFLLLSDSICLRFVCIGQYNDDSLRSRRFTHQKQQPQQQQQQHEHRAPSHGVGSDEDDNESSSLFRTKYEYTPLKDYAAMKNGVRVTSETSSNGLQSK